MATRLVTQQVDVAGWLRLDHPRLMIEVGRGRRDPFAPFGFAAGVKTVDSNERDATHRVPCSACQRERRPGLTLSGWYFDPIVGGSDFEPPRHARVSATFYSKFWRVFKSGIFALRGENRDESWSRSALGGCRPARSDR